MSWIVSVVGDVLEERWFRDGCYVEIVSKKLAEGAVLERIEAFSKSGEVRVVKEIRSGQLKFEGSVGYRIPFHEVDELLDIFSRVFRKDGDYIAGLVFILDFHTEGE